MKVRNCLAAICLLGCVSVASAHGSYGFFYDDGDSSISIGKSGAHSAPVAPAPHYTHSPAFLCLRYLLELP